MKTHIQSLIIALETTRLQHGNLEVMASDGVRIVPITSVATPVDEHGGRVAVLTGEELAHTIDALRDIVNATAAYHQFDVAGRPWLQKALDVLGSEHPDTDLHRAGCAHCQYVHDSNLPDV